MGISLDTSGHLGDISGTSRQDVSGKSQGISGISRDILPSGEADTLLLRAAHRLNAALRSLLRGRPLAECLRQLGAGGIFEISPVLPDKGCANGGGRNKPTRRLSEDVGVRKQKKCSSSSFAQNSVAAVCARVVLSMSPKLSCNCAVVGKPGVWKVTTLKNKKRVEKFSQRELHAPAPWTTVSYGSKRLTTNAKLVRRTWERPVGGSGNGVELDPVVISPRLLLGRGKYHPQFQFAFGFP